MHVKTRSRHDTWTIKCVMDNSAALKTVVTLTAGVIIGSLLTSYLRPSPSSSAKYIKTTRPTIIDTDSAGLDATGMDQAGGELRLLRKAETVLRHRTSQIMLVIERSIDTHNYSAIIRTAEAMGIHHLWVINPPNLDGSGAKDQHRQKRKANTVWVEDEKKKKEHVAFAKKAGKWLNIRSFDSTEECLVALGQDGRTIWVTELSQMAYDLEDLLGTECPGNPLPERLAVVFGSEGMGVSSTMLDAADKRIYLKMHGFADSLNLSVSAALVMQRLLLCQPSTIGNMSNEERAVIRNDWYPRMARTEEQREMFTQTAQDENNGIFKVKPYVDVRRPEGHRRVWMKKRARKKMGALGAMKYQGEIEK